MRRFATQKSLALAWLVATMVALFPSLGICEQDAADRLVVLLPVHAPEHLASEAARIDSLLAAGLAPHKRIVDAQASRQAAGWSGAGSRETFVRRLLSEAESELLALRYPQAEALCAQALRELERGAADVFHPAIGSAVGMTRARLFHETGRQSELEAVLAEIARSYPDFEPTEANHHPELVAAWQRARDREAPAPPSLPTTARLLDFGRRTSIDGFIVASTLSSSASSGLTLTLIVIDIQAGVASLPSTDIALGDREGWTASLDSALSPVRTALAPRALPTELFILTDPPGAEVSVDGLRTGEQTPVALEVEPGPHQITLSHENRETVELDIVAWEGQTRPVEARFGPSRAARAARVARRRAVLRSWWLWTIVGVVVAGGAATAIGLGIASAQDNPDVHVTVRNPLIQ